MLDDRVARMRGAELKLALEGSRRGVLSDFSYIAGAATLRTFLVPWEGDNVGLQVAGQITTARDDSHLFRAGGLFEVRGFPDAYFIGQRLIRANLEYRKELARYTLIVPTVMQAAAFADGGHVSGRSGAVAGLSYEGPFASAGGGLRFVLIPITRAVARVDVAAGLHPRNTIDISLGGQQFF
jgi:hemolysin activation/secretion protein